MIGWSWKWKESYRHFRPYPTFVILQQNSTTVRRPAGSSFYSAPACICVGIFCWYVDWLVNLRRSSLTVMSYSLANVVLCANQAVTAVRSNLVPCLVHWPMSMIKSWKISSSPLKLSESELAFSPMEGKSSKCTFHHKLSMSKLIY
jgi:hypothetical protein